MVVAVVVSSCSSCRSSSNSSVVVGVGVEVAVVVVVVVVVVGVVWYQWYSSTTMVPWYVRTYYVRTRVRRSRH